MEVIRKPRLDKGADSIYDSAVSCFLETTKKESAVYFGVERL